MNAVKTVSGPSTADDVTTPNGANTVNGVSSGDRGAQAPRNPMGPGGAATGESQ